MKKLYFLLLTTCCLLSICEAQRTDTLISDRDNTLYEDMTGNLSNGAGDYLFAGKTNNGLIRRGLIHFDVSSIPTNATVTAVSVILRVTRQNTGPHAVELRRLTTDWGEGSSNAPGQEGQGAQAVNGDATWVQNYFRQSNWTSPGGDVIRSISATASVNTSNGFITFSGGQLIAGVQGWVDGTISNFGWLIRGDESRNNSAKRFASRENPNNSFKPTLLVTYTIATDLREEQIAANISLSPNPVEKVLLLKGDMSLLQSKVSLRNLSGQVVMNYSLKDNQSSFDVSELASGIYFVQFMTIEGNVFFKKLIKR